MNRFVIPTRVYSGTDCLEQLERYRDRNVWVVCDGFLVKGGAIARLLEHLDTERVSLFSDIMPDPPITTVVAGIQRLQEIRPQVVIGFGGGSAIDAAKAMVFFGRKLGIRIETFIAIPTTSGTGTEVSSASVISDPALGIKYPLFDDTIFPDIALLDPQLVVSVPAAVTANTGMDVLTHAVEAYVSINAGDFSDALAEKATQLVFHYLPTACAKGDCLHAREKMHNASTLAGMAFSQAGLGLTHAIAHQLGGQLHVPHGLANALLLVEVIRFNSQEPRAVKRYARLARLCGMAAQQNDDRAALNQLLNHIGQLKREIGIPASLSQLHLGAERIRQVMPAMIRTALLDSTLVTNPRLAQADDIENILHAIN